MKLVHHAYRATLGSLLLALSLMLAASSCPADSLNYCTGGHDIMAIFLNGHFVEMGQPCIWCRQFTGSKLVTRHTLKIDHVQDYTFRRGAITGQGDRFWLLGGEGTVRNVKWETIPHVYTGQITTDGRIDKLRRLRPLPFPVKTGRALIHEGRLWHLGGYKHDELLSAKILPEGELGEWQQHRAYPMAVSSGGFVFYKGCFYANGKCGYWPGSSKMYGIKLSKLAKGRPWKRVDSPEHAQGALIVHRDALFYFDEISGNIYKATQEPDGLQLTDWTIAGKMPSPPNTEGVTVVEGPGGWFIFGGIIRKDGKFAGFHKGTFMPHDTLK